MKQLTDNDRKLLCALSDIEMVLDNVELSVPQVEKIWGSFKVIQDIVYTGDIITGVITMPTTDYATKIQDFIKELVEEHNKIKTK